MSPMIFKISIDLNETKIQKELSMLSSNMFVTSFKFKSGETVDLNILKLLNVRVRI